MRSHPAAVGAYAEIKRQLARYHPDDQEFYYDIKDPVCDLIIAAAEEWARHSGWLPGPSDQ
ncbi:MAG: GrpB family protein [Ktedonobacterales bacterium]|nr:GrpB family protein [Ktedonobacterales bacterium]